MGDKDLKTTPLNTRTTVDQRNRARAAVAHNALDAADCRRLQAMLGLITLFWQCPICLTEYPPGGGGGVCKNRTCKGDLLFRVRVELDDEIE